MKPISQPSTDEDKLDRTTSIVRTSTTLETAEPFMLSVAEKSNRSKSVRCVTGKDC